MVRASRLLVGLLALGLLAPVGSFAAESAAKGTIKGKVTGVDGKPAAGVTVRILEAAPGKPAVAGEKKKDAEKHQAEGKKKAKKGAEGEAPAAGDKPKPAAAVATATTDGEGNFSVEVPAGEYRVSANQRGVGAGNAKVTVKAGETVEVSVTMKEPKKKPAA